MNKKQISIIIPVYNEEDNIEKIYREIKNIFNNNLKNFKYEIIFTDNNSTDNSFKIIKKITNTDTNVKLIKFSNNFGVQNAIFTGIKYSSGDAIIQIDCDMQDPPSLIVEFVENWHLNHYDIISGVRDKRSDAFLQKFIIKFYYRILNYIDQNQAIDVGDFRLISRKVADHLLKYDSDDLYIRGIISKIGFKNKFIKYSRKKREFGKSKFNFFKLMDFGLDGVTSVSYKPIKFATYFSILFFLLSLLIFTFFLLQKIFIPENQPSGFATIISLIMIFFSINCLIFSIFGQYLIRIAKQTSKGPNVIVEELINFK